ncbi:MBL fold metallo-hydrolase [Methylomonas methanica]|uniref:MBL fold metallo-hydrolase n=1 Tax=Methylomonas methanica TaxID=421 RepID=A0A177MHX2_METMH|nr:MBL fold metallo-hydrolase [Methylomonas methanica]OAI04945.1 MBL fold metallo-hydrolase [Methylomonas methanica]
MKFKFWGVRGSIATPGPSTVKYGGNTTCIEVTSSAGDLIILDAGTGIHALAQSLQKHPLTAHILITHTHWDHIQGLPFFLPMFKAGNIINIYGGLEPLTHQGIERAMHVQLQHSYFPISEAQLKAEVRYFTLKANAPITVGSVRVTPTVLNHPVYNFGYRLDDVDGSSLFFTGDYEPQLNPYQADHPGYPAMQELIEQKHEEVIAAMAGVDALIMDSSYTDTEYANRHGWGHGTYRSAMNFAAQAGAKRLFLTHHEPTRSDADLEAIFESLLQVGESEVLVCLAREGEGFELLDSGASD